MELFGCIQFLRSVGVRGAGYLENSVVLYTFLCRNSITNPSFLGEGRPPCDLSQTSLSPGTTKTVGTGIYSQATEV